MFGKKNIRVHPRHPCSVKKISVSIRIIRVRQKEYPCSSVSSVGDKKKICCIFCMFHFFFLPLHHACIPWRVKQVMSCCVGGRRTEVPRHLKTLWIDAVAATVSWDKLLPLIRKRTFTNVSLLRFENLVNFLSHKKITQRGRPRRCIITNGLHHAIIVS